jgi:hypothetical protein
VSGVIHVNSVYLLERRNARNHAIPLVRIPRGSLRGQNNRLRCIQTNTACCLDCLACRFLLYRNPTTIIYICIDPLGPNHHQIYIYIYIYISVGSQPPGPMAHPIRPESYVAMDNFYTATVRFRYRSVGSQPQYIRWACGEHTTVLRCGEHLLLLP